MNNSVTSSVGTIGSISSMFSISQGVYQKSILSPHLFTLVNEWTYWSDVG